MNSRSPVQSPDPHAVLGRALISGAARLGVRNNRLAEVIGASEATISRLAAGRGIDPAGKQGELALLFLRMFRSLDALFGGNEAQCRQWLHSANQHLAGIPADRIRTVEGLVDVIQYLDGMRGRM
jgi:hypothetical protein